MSLAMLDIRAAIGDPDGKLTLTEVVDRVRVLVKLRDFLLSDAASATAARAYERSFWGNDSWELAPDMYRESEIRHHHAALAAVLKAAECDGWPRPIDEVLREAGIPRNEERERQRMHDGIRHFQG